MNWTVLPALAERDAGFNAVIGEYKKIKVTEMEIKVPGQVDDTFNKVTDYLTGHKDVKAIWMGWDEVGVAAARAVQQSHVEHKPFVVSMDGNDAAYDLIRDGSPLWLTVAYDVRGMGVQAVQAVADAVDGKAFDERQIYKKPCLITKDDRAAEGPIPRLQDLPALFGGCRRGGRNELPLRSPIGPACLRRRSTPAPSATDGAASRVGRPDDRSRGQGTGQAIPRHARARRRRPRRSGAAKCMRCSARTARASRR